MLQGGAVAKGRVKWFNELKGFGFIEDENGQDVFVHYTAVKDRESKVLPEGCLVEFERTESERGPLAEAVRVLNEPSEA